MRKLTRGSFVILAAMAVVVSATTASGARKAATVKSAVGPIDTGVSYMPLPSDADTATQFKRIRAAGAKYV